MAHMATIRILVDEGDESRVCDGINEMMRNAQKPIEEGGEEWIIDWSIDAVEETLSELDDSISNDTYEEGDAFREWVMFSLENYTAHAGAGFWSNQYGWTTLNLATKFDAVKRAPGKGAIWMLAPYNLSFHQLKVEAGTVQDGGINHRSTYWFHCWARNIDHALEQAQKAYPGCYVHQPDEEGEYE